MSIVSTIKSRNDKLSTICKDKPKLLAIKHSIQIYNHRGLIMTKIRADGKFDLLTATVAEIGLTLKTVSEDDHVTEIYWFMRTVTDQSRCIYKSLPFCRFSQRIIIKLIYACDFWLNIFPLYTGISDRLSPDQIVFGRTYISH